MGTVLLRMIASRQASRSPPVERSITVSAPQRSAQLQLFDFFVGAGRDRRGAHVGVDLGLRRPADGHRIELVAQVHVVGRNDHAPGGDFVAHLLGRQMRLRARRRAAFPA